MLSKRVRYAFFAAGRLAAFFAAGRFFAAFFAAGRFFAAFFAAGRFFAAFFAAGRFLAAFFAAGRFLAGAFLAAFFAAGRFLAGAFLAAAFFLAGAFLAGAFFFAAGATFPPWDSTLNQIGTLKAPSGVPTASHRIDISCTRPCATQSHDCTATDRSAWSLRGRAFFTALQATRGTT
jgi:hypothetical protein